MSDNISRRRFIQTGLAAAGALTASRLPLPSAVQAAPKEELATWLDIGKCIGCGACVDACKATNAHKFPEPEQPFPKMYPDRVKVSDWSQDREVRDRLTPYTWLYIQQAQVQVGGQEETIYIPRRCMHCQNPPCANLCPWGAARKLQNGITQIHPDICLGGSKCNVVCPWHIPQRQTGVGLYLKLLPSLAGNGVMFKCDRCLDRVAEGELPACIEACPQQLQRLGPRQAIIEEARARAEEIGGYIYGEEENGGTNTIYVSPVPFEELNQAIAQGPGQPHLEPVQNSMSQAENLGQAMLFAPLAGVAAAALRFWGSSRSKEQKQEDKS
ncbi:MAG: 4Fe-4S dicluster domain-containing protein [Desulfohalobiaceae bacterium]